LFYVNITTGSIELSIFERFEKKYALNIYPIHVMYYDY
jgi:hypothetical protein